MQYRVMQLGYFVNSLHDDLTRRLEQLLAGYVKHKCYFSRVARVVRTSTVWLVKRIASLTGCYSARR